MIRLPLSDKKGVSEMMSYVILIIIAIGLSVLVFGALTLYVPKDKPTCGPDISLSIQDFSCNFDSDANEANLTISLVNKGKFAVHAAYVRFGKEGQEVRDLINDPENRATSGSFMLNPSDARTGLLPGESTTRDYKPNIASNIVVATETNYEVEIQPAVFNEGELAICPDAVRVQPVTCDAPAPSATP